MSVVTASLTKSKPVSIPSGNVAVSQSVTVAPPTGLEINVTSLTSLTLNWTDVATSGIVQIERSLLATTYFVQIATVANGVGTYLNTGLTTDVTYYYRIRALKVAFGESAYSSIVPGTPTAA